MRPLTSKGHNFFVRTPFQVFLDSIKISLSQDSIHIPVEGSGYWSWPTRVGRVGKATHVRPTTSEGHNFFVRTPFRVFLDFMESPLSQESIHIKINEIRTHVRSINHEK